MTGIHLWKFQCTIFELLSIFTAGFMQKIRKRSDLDYAGLILVVV